MEAHRGGITSSSIFLVLRFIICPILLLSRWDGHLWKPRAPNMESHRSGGIISLPRVVTLHSLALWCCHSLRKLPLLELVKVVNHYYWEHTRTVLMNTGRNTLLQSWMYASWELVNRQLRLVVTGHLLSAYVTIVRRAESHTRTKISWNIDALNKRLSVAKHSRLTP